MEQRYTKNDFYVGQEVYAEYIGLTSSRNKKGNISVETVTKLGNKYVTTNKRMYQIADGFLVTEYSPDYVLWLNKSDLETKIAKDKLFSKLLSEFSSGVGILQNRKLYKRLSLEDLQEIKRIIDKGESNNGNSKV